MSTSRMCGIVVLAILGMALCQAGLVIGIVDHGMDPWNWKKPLESAAEKLVFVQGNLSQVQALRIYALAAGAAALFGVAVLSQNKMYSILEAFLTPSALLSLLSWGVLLTIPLRIILSAIVFCALVRMGLLEKITWKQILRGEIPANWYGGAGIEFLGVGHISTLSHFHTIGGVLLSWYSWLGWRTPQLPDESEDEAALRQKISLFWLFLNVPFAVLAAVEAYLQTLAVL